MKSTKRIIKFFVALVFVFGIFACVKNTALAGEKVLIINGTNVLDQGINEADGWSYDSTTNTITLNNLTLVCKRGFIDARYMGKLNIKLIGTNQVYVETYDPIVGEGTDLYFTGSGSLTITGTYSIIKGDNVSIDGCTISAEGGEGYYASAIVARNLIINNAVVTAKRSSEEDELSGGIDVDTLSITNSTLMASGRVFGIRTRKDTEIGSGAAIIADGGNYGMKVLYEGNIKISKDIKSLVLTGGKNAISIPLGKVQNELEGTAWTDIDGKVGETKILVKDEDINYDDFKKVIFVKPESKTPPVEDPEIITIPGTTVVSETPTAVVNEKLDESLKVPTLKSIKKDKKSLTIKWKKISKKIKGYQFQYSTDPNFEKNVKTVNVSNPKTDMRKVKKLKSKTKYYVRIRSFKKVGSEKVYSNWSKTKSAKTK